MAVASIPRTGDSGGVAHLARQVWSNWHRLCTWLEMPSTDRWVLANYLTMEKPPSRLRRRGTPRDRRDHPEKGGQHGRHAKPPHTRCRSVTMVFLLALSTLRTILELHTRRRRLSYLQDNREA